MAKQTVKNTKTKTTTVSITPKKTATAKNQKRCPTCGAFRK